MQTYNIGDSVTTPDGAGEIVDVETARASNNRTVFTGRYGVKLWVNPRPWPVSYYWPKDISQKPWQKEVI